MKKKLQLILLKITFILFNHNFPIIIDNTFQTDATFLWNLQYASFTTIFHLLKIQTFSFQNIKKFFSLNIGFGTPSQDKYALCKHFKNHSKMKEEECHICAKRKDYKDQYHAARNCYQEDVAKQFPFYHCLIACDMQKVIMLPKTELKLQYFIEKLTVFIERFSLLSVEKYYCVVWNESKARRNAADVTSAYFR